MSDDKHIKLIKSAKENIRKDERISKKGERLKKEALNKKHKK